MSQSKFPKEVKEIHILDLYGNVEKIIKIEEIARVTDQFGNIKKFLKIREIKEESILVNDTE